MKFVVNPSWVAGEVVIPGSKSHTIRALVFSLLADGESTIERPLKSSDTASCCRMIEKFGASITESGDNWKVKGRGGSPAVPDDIIDVGNSGTSLYIGIGIASIVDGVTVFTGDFQIRNRPADSLLAAIVQLGGEAFSTRGNGKPPLVVKGRIKGGSAKI
jgi:3-phosphoshikimate 1-carboxyvinyltransferase